MLIKKWNKQFKKPMFLLLLLGLLILAVTSVDPTYAASLTVDSTADSLADDGVCTLREAITNANNDDQSGSVDCAAGSGADTITFSVDGTITLGSTLPEITSEMTIDGTGQTVTVSGDNAYRVMVVNASGTLNLNALTIADGLIDAPNEHGGGILNYGALTISTSTFTGNSAASQSGGAINNRDGVLTITNSTFSGNSASSGGALYNYGGSVTLTNVTISGNVGGGIVKLYGYVTLQNSLVASNGGQDCYQAISGGGLTADSSNMDSDGTCDNAITQTAVQLNLGSLSDNGGETQTIAVLPGSTAIDAGDDATCSATDQRSVTRPQGAHCDVGAYEVEPGSITIVKDAVPADGTDFTFTTDALTTGNYLFQWGSGGNGDGQFDLPRGMAIDAAGNVYVADSFNDRIQVFNSDGTYLTQWGSFGSGDGQFDTPIGVAVDAAGNVYVTDGVNDRIQVFDSNGVYQSQWGSSGSGDGQFDLPTSVAVAAAGTVYVTDTFNDRVQVFDSNGTYLTQLGGTGSGNGQFSIPYGVAVDSTGNVYVVDTGNNRIQKFASDGTYLTQWGSGGIGNGEFADPLGIAVDVVGNLYVTDNFIGRVQKFDSNGTYLTQWGSIGSDNGQFDSTSRVAVNAAGMVYVTDENNDRVQVFSSNTFSLDDALQDDGDTITDSRIISDLLPGSYIFTETVTAGWMLTDLACDSDNWNVNDSSVTVNLSEGEAVTCTFSNSVEVTNYLPIAVNDAYNTDEGTQLDVAAPGVLGNDSDADGDGLTAVLIDDASNGDLTLNADGSFSYLPDAGFTGDDTFTYVANDGSGDSGLATVTITVEMTASGPTCQGVPATIVGTDGNDILIGTDGDDVIVGLNGDDIIRGKGGNDLICGGKGDDWLIGGSGDDKLHGGPGWDTLFGNTGNDELHGGFGDDWLYGGLGDDLLFGKQGWDVLYGGPGADELHGGPGQDWLLGDGGNDALDGGLGDNDTCQGGADTDTAVNCEAVYGVP